jgi:hypothetical protein
MTTPVPIKYDVHPLANKLPPMSEDEFSRLVEDIRANGLRVPITIYQGQILDGRHRYRAAEKAGRPLTAEHFVEFKPNGSDSPIKFVIGQNVNRRHLNESQRALIAADIADIEKGGNQYSKGGSIDLPTAAKMLNVGEASVKRAKNFLTKAAPELVEEVRQGQRRVTSVSKDVLKKPKAEQAKAIETEETKRKAAKDNLSERVDKLVKALLAVLKDMEEETAKASAADVIKELKKARYA